MATIAPVRINPVQRPTKLDGCWSSWSEQDVASTVATEMENGGFKVRRRFTGRQRVVNVSVTMDTKLYNDFMGWFRNDQQAGSIPTFVKTPVGVEEAFFFGEPPSISFNEGAVSFTASTTLVQPSWLIGMVP